MPETVYVVTRGIELTVDAPRGSVVDSRKVLAVSTLTGCLTTLKITKELAELPLAVLIDERVAGEDPQAVVQTVQKIHDRYPDVQVFVVSDNRGNAEALRAEGVVEVIPRHDQERVLSLFGQFAPAEKVSV